MKTRLAGIAGMLGISRSGSVESSSPQQNNAPGEKGRHPGNARRIERMEERMILKRRWAYLRYLHTREALMQAEDVESILVIGSGHGFAEITLALEFPGIHFHLTDVKTANTPNYHNAKKFVDEWGLDNVTFGIRNILVPEPGRYDMVTSVEVLEHIENDALAAAEMRAAARKYVYLLVPFAEKAVNEDRSRRAHVYEALGHYVAGYDEEKLRSLFPDVVAMRGCYWSQHGRKHRERLYELTNEEIQPRMAELQEEAKLDVLDDIPTTESEAQGIWLLARV